MSSGLARKLGDGAETAMKAVQGEQESRDATRANRMTLQARGRIEEESRAGYITRQDINRRALYIHVVLGGQRIC